MDLDAELELLLFGLGLGQVLTQRKAEIEYGTAHCFGLA